MVLCIDHVAVVPSHQRQASLMAAVLQAERGPLPDTLPDGTLARTHGIVTTRQTGECKYTSDHSMMRNDAQKFLLASTPCMSCIDCM